MVVQIYPFCAVITNFCFTFFEIFLLFLFRNSRSRTPQCVLLYIVQVIVRRPSAVRTATAEQRV
ncbi:MAG: hypothetical protein HXL34_06695 [Prevotellaceae bacterium]|nr:hypothetical protein [Prevotellaceae bacterium]